MSRSLTASAAVAVVLCALGGAARLALGQPAPTVDVVSQAKGEAALQEAREHMQAHRWSQAIEAYNAVLVYLPGNAEALRGIERAQQATNEAPMLQDVAQELSVQRGRAQAEFDTAIGQAQSLLRQQDFAGAQTAALTAQIRLRQSRHLFSEREYAQMSKQATDLLGEIDRQREEWEARRQLEIQAEADAQRREAQLAEQQARQRLIEENLRRVRELQQEQKYEAALQVVDEILFIDEINPAALVLRDIIETTILYREYAETQKHKERSIAWLSLEAQRGMSVPHRNISGAGDRSVSGVVSYPEDWPSLSLRRTDLGGLAETPENRYVARVLSDTRVPVVDFTGNRFEDVVRYLGTVSGKNIYVDWKALDFIGVGPDDAVTLSLNDVSVENVLDRVLQQLGDGYDRPQWSIQDGIVSVSSEESLRRNTATLVYDIRDLLFEVPYFGNAPDMDLARAMSQAATPPAGGGAGNFGGRSGGPSPVFGDPAADKQRPDRQEIVDQIVGIIQETVDPAGWRDMGGDTGSLQELNGNLIITNTLRNHRQIEGLLSQLREIRALQINVEGRLLIVSTDWFEQIGVDLDLYFNTNSDVRNAQLAADPLGHLSDFFNPDGSLRDPLIYTGLNQQPDPSTPPFSNQNSFGTAFGVPDATGQNIIYQVGPVGAPIRTTEGFAPIGFVQDSLGLLGSIADLSGFGETVMMANPALTLGIQFLDDVQVDLLIEATQADRRSVVLTAPKLTLFNGQRAWTAVANQVAYVSALVPITGDAAIAFQPIPGVVNDGVVLDVEGVISADRRYVTMTVITSVSKIEDIREFEVEGAVGGTGLIPGGAVVSSSIELPEVRVALVQTTVSVPDKGTVLLGGQRLVSEVEAETGVPMLSKIPFINRFFTNRLTSKTEETLLVLIRPEIIIQQENEDILFPGLSDSLGGAASFMR
jgi:type II secretory pathway component GspD/PulD (secretin)/tetratricopeptide (TPR) repeat protein